MSNSALTDTIQLDGRTIGAVEARTVSTNYLADTDGFFVGKVTCSAPTNAGRVICYTDATATPTTAITGGSAHYTTGETANIGGFCVPIKAGNYYRGELFQDTSADGTFYWYPLRSAEIIVPNGGIESFHESQSTSLSATTTTSAVDSGLTAITFTPASATNLIDIRWSLTAGNSSDYKQIVGAPHIASTGIQLHGAQNNSMGTSAGSNTSFNITGNLIVQLPAVSQTFKVYFWGFSAGTVTVTRGSLQVIEWTY